METVHTRASRPRILIADDHAVFAEALCVTLEKTFDVIGLAADGRSMLEESIRLRPDVIVADVSMPLLNGLDSARRIREQTPNVKFVFILGYPDEDGPPLRLPHPELLSRNGSFMAYRRLEEHVGAFRDFLKEHGKTPEEQELVAAKLMGRWRSGAPLVLAPDKDDPELGADPQRHNDFNYKQQDPFGYAVPLGSHIRRMNPRDTGANMNRRRMIRRGATYGPYLPEGAPEDSKERGIAAFVICASLIRQFEFAQNVWANDRNTSDAQGAIGGGGGFADSSRQPANLTPAAATTSVLAIGRRSRRRAKPSI